MENKEATAVVREVYDAIDHTKRALFVLSAISPIAVRKAQLDDRTSATKSKTNPPPSAFFSASKKSEHASHRFTALLLPMTCFPTLNQDLGPDFLQSRRKLFTHALLFEEFLHLLLGGIVLMQELLDKNDFFLPEQADELRRLAHHILHAHSPTGATKISILPTFQELQLSTQLNAR